MAGNPKLISSVSGIVSPISSLDIQSTRDTPATPLTFSSEDKFRLLKGKVYITHAVKPPMFAIETCNAISNTSAVQGDPCLGSELDPFVPSVRSVIPTAERSCKLSATASSFYPTKQTIMSSPLERISQSRTFIEAESQARSENVPQTECLPNFACFGQLERSRQNTATNIQQPDLQDLDVDAASLASHATCIQPIDPSTLTARACHIVPPVSSNTQETRYLKIANLPSEYFRVYLDAVLATPIVSRSRLAVIDHATSHGIALLRYDDICNAVSSLSKIRSEFPEWSSGFASSHTWRSLAKCHAKPFSSEYEGQVIVTLSQKRHNIETGIGSPNCDQYYSALVGLMNLAGIKAAETVENENPKQPFPGLELNIAKYERQVEEIDERVCLSQQRMKIQPFLPEWNRHTSNMDANNRPHTSIVSTQMHAAAAIGRMTSKAGSLHVLDDAISNHNTVDVDRIKNGQDVRTTIMLRNIPNKVDQPTLKKIVDGSSLGKYDFMYLRIDFANNCNVGYAFINFENSPDIVNFVKSIAGRRWDCFNSDKVAEVSYATIQGKDCLIQKFRNSSVMLEAPLFRPKMYYTGIGPLAGQEEDFPAPDNQSKMRRSLENAEHVGLFAPRLGRRTREELRGGRSRYDRGTRFAEAHRPRDS